MFGRMRVQREAWPKTADHAFSISSVETTGCCHRFRFLRMFLVFQMDPVFRKAQVHRTARGLPTDPVVRPVPEVRKALPVRVQESERRLCCY